MALKATSKIHQYRDKPEIDLTGPDGNAFALLSMVRGFCRDLGRDPKPIMDEMIAGDYENLVKVFTKEFGKFVTLHKQEAV